MLYFHLCNNLVEDFGIEIAKEKVQKILYNLSIDRTNQLRDKANKLTPMQYKAISAIEKCRASKLGGHMDVCPNCGNVQISYNSCRNRHCPKCQTLAKERWIYNQKSNLLNIPYFHVVFSIPDTLNLMTYQNSLLLNYYTKLSEEIYQNVLTVVQTNSLGLSIFVTLLRQA